VAIRPVAVNVPAAGLKISAEVVAGVVLHAVLLGSLMGYLRGSVSLDQLIIIQIVNPLLSALIVILGAGRRSVRRFAT